MASWREYNELSGKPPELLSRPELVEGQTPQWHSKEIATLVQIDGYAVFWSTLFNEVVAFVLDDSYLPLIPNGIVIYTIAELALLFGSGSCHEETLLRLHKEKKLLKARLIDYQGDNKQ